MCSCSAAVPHQLTYAEATLAAFPIPTLHCNQSAHRIQMTSAREFTCGAWRELHTSPIVSSCLVTHIAYIQTSAGKLLYGAQTDTQYPAWVALPCDTSLQPTLYLSLGATPQLQRHRFLQSKPCSTMQAPCSSSNGVYKQVKLTKQRAGCRLFATPLTIHPSATHKPCVCKSGYLTRYPHSCAGTHEARTHVGYPDLQTHGRAGAHEAHSLVGYPD
eukprot:scaffold151367_cov19-Tisochrysis_lutea.AAC.1